MTCPAASLGLPDPRGRFTRSPRSSTGSLARWLVSSRCFRRLGSALCVIFAALTSSGLTAQASAPPPGDEIWGPLRLLEGTWEGQIDGALGVGVGRRAFEFLFGGMYLVARHASVRLPQPQSPQGDHHRELAIYSYDRERGTLVLREFMVEGYVLQSTCSTEPTRVVCTDEAIESGPGMMSRLTLEITDPYRFVEIFELAGPGEPLRTLLTNTWTRVPDLGVRR